MQQEVARLNAEFCLVTRERGNENIKYLISPSGSPTHNPLTVARWCPCITIVSTHTYFISYNITYLSRLKMVVRERKIIPLLKLQLPGDMLRPHPSWLQINQTTSTEGKSLKGKTFTC